MKTHHAVAMIIALGLASAHAGSRAYNLSARGNVGTGDNVLIGGVIVGEPPEPGPCEDGGPDGKGAILFAVRALGPSLVAEQVSNTMADPTIAFYDDEGTLLFSQDSYLESTPEVIALLAAYDLTPSDPRECATMIALLPGHYTAIVSGADDTTGVALLEIYKLSAANK